MARFNDVDVFLAVADEASFRGAAARLDVTRSTVSRAIARLEAHLGTALLLRDNASVRLTDAGAAYRSWARRAATALTEAERAARSVSGEVSGTIRITAVPAIGPGILTPIIAEFMTRYPGVAVDMLLTDRVVNPILDDVDIAVRLGQRLADSELKSRKLADLDVQAVASPQLAARLDSLEVVPSVVFAPEHGHAWHYEGAPALLQPRLRVNDYLSVVAALEAGVGVGVVSTLLVAGALREGRLVQVWPAWKLPPGKAWAVYPARGRVPHKIRLMLDALREGFADPGH